MRLKTAPPKSAVPAKLKGMRFAFAGRLSHQKPIREWIKKEGGKALPDVTAQATHLVVGQKRGSGPTPQEKKAARLNQNGASIQIIGEEDFFHLLVPSREEAIALLTGNKKQKERWNALHPRYGDELCGLIPMPDLQGADLRKANLCDVNLTGIPLDDADLRQADLSCAEGLQATAARLDKARLVYAQPKALVNCSLRGADLTNAFESSPRLEGSDCTGAKLDEGHFFYCKGSGAIFRQANLRGRDCNGSVFQNADFAGADLSGANLDNCDLTGANFQGALLADALLTEAKLVRADLRRADLRGADLAGADLRETQVDGANFEGAKLLGAKLTGVDLAKARGLEAAAKPVGRQAGPKVNGLEAIAKQCESFRTTAIVARPNKPSINMNVFCYDRGQMLGGGATVGEEYSGNEHSCLAKQLPALFLELAGQWGAGDLLLDSITFDYQKAPLRKNQLRVLVDAAWCEAFGKELPSAAEREKASDRARADFVKLLRRGQKGVAEWNADAGRLMRAGHFHGVDLSGLDLTGFTVHHGLDFTGADFNGSKLNEAHACYGSKLTQVSFRRAVLRDAYLTHDCSGADFTGAVLTNTDFSGGLLKKAVFKNAKLTQVDLSRANLSGADFTGAKLAEVDWNHARFDQETQFPRGFEPPPEMKWAGTGPDPRLARKKPKASGPIDFDTFMQNLEASADPAKLAKALAMLKADRFQLYAQVTPKELVGVVKSQTDAELVYSCRLCADGSYGCCTQNLNICGGLRGSLCKHLLVLLVGLGKAGQLDPTAVNQWVEASHGQKPVLDKDAMSQTLLRYKGAEAGEVDWRPTETLPEDYYAL
jgi:uncharacterized protein YjbI with pentapeptide repeats